MKCRALCTQLIMSRLLLLWGLMSACSEPEFDVPPATQGVFELRVNPAHVGLLLPGGYFKITGANLINEAQYEVSLDLNVLPERISLEVISSEGGELTVRWPVQTGLTAPTGMALGSILVQARTSTLSGAARAEWSADLQYQVSPQLSRLSDLVSPQTAAPISGDNLLNPGEGQSILALSGVFTRRDGVSNPFDVSIPLEVSAEPTESAASLLSFDRQQRWWTPSPTLFGISAGRFEGTAQVSNQGEGGLTIGEPIPVAFEYSEPFISSVTPQMISRGQQITIGGGGFVDLIDGQNVGLTSVSLSGTLTPFNPSLPPVEYRDELLEIERRSGSRLTTSFDPTFNSACESTDLGGVFGAFQGELSATVYWSDQEITTAPLPVSLEIAPSKQVVYLSFLPAFTDSLRLFGLRNVSARVIDEILAVVRRDFAGINLELRTSPPLDFARYSIVELGGPDPNARSLFGLDNTTGLDHCNQRLDDALAGRNAESGDSYGGVFVESFLNLSPTRSAQPSALADPLFDEIFNPVINSPAQLNDLEGARQAEVTRAIAVLSHLVGNTLTHEIGHSLGLPVVPGCGEYHNAPGPRQIMDCGQDRPFLERAGLDPSGPPQWTADNLQYLQAILPL